MTYSIRSERGPTGDVVTVAGDADASASAALDDAVRSAVGGGRDSVMVDLSGAMFIDSRTIGVLARWTEKLRAEGGRLPIVCADPNILRLFTLIGLEQVLDLFETRAEAAAAG